MKPILLKTIPSLAIGYLLCFIGIPAETSAQCIASTTRSASTFANDNAIGDIPFDNPGRAVSSNNSYADADALAVLFAGTTQYLKATNFGFTIPTDAAICGVVVEIERTDGGFLSIGTGIRDNQVSLVIGNSVTGNNKAAAGNWGTADTYVTYGGSGDVWGTTLTPAIVNSSNFGVAISAKFNGIAALVPSADIDHIRMIIYYNPTLPTHIISFTSSLKFNKVKLDWKTADEEDGEVVHLQRSTNGQSNWENIARFDMHTGNTIQSYTYTDVLGSKGNYLYRLQVTNVNGQQIFSATRNVLYGGERGISVFPNPASDFITIENVSDPQGISIISPSMKSLKLPVISTGINKIKLDVSQLPVGVYFARNDAGYVKFLKR
jgi:hypothetical protein